MNQVRHPRASTRALLIVAIVLLGMAGMVGTPGSRALGAAETDPTARPLVEVDGRPITLRELEMSLLKKEGTEQLDDWVPTHLGKIDWLAVPEDALLLTVNGVKLTRHDLALQLLKTKAALATREEMINQRLVTAAMAKQGLVLDAGGIDGAWRMMERIYTATQKDPHQQLDFTSYIRANENCEPEEYRKRPKFIILACLRLLAIHQEQTAIDQAQLQRWFDDHHQQWDTPEAVELADIFVQYQQPNENERDKILNMLFSMYRDIAAKNQDFAATWSAFKTWDPDAEEGGKIGWVTRAGVREKATARKLPPELMEQAFAQKKLPALLQPYPGVTGVDLVRVDGHRPGQAAVLAQVKDQVVVDLVEAQLDRRVTDLLTALRTAADIHYESLPTLLDHPGTDAVVTVDATPITLHQLEDALLLKEGSNQMADWMQSQMGRINWDTLPDTAVVLTVAGNNLTRQELTFQLLRQPGAASKAREDLIEIALVENEIQRQKITLDGDALDGAWKSMEREYYATQTDSDKHLTFAQSIRVKEGYDPAEFRTQPGFKVFATLRQLAIRKAKSDLTDAALLEWFNAHHQQWDEPAAVDLADIYVPYQHAGDAERDRVLAMMTKFHRSILAKQADFGLIWADFKDWDPDAGPGGALGWVSKEGVRQKVTARHLPAAVMAQAFTVTPLPALLPPVAGPLGVDLVRVDRRRDGTAVAFAGVRDQVLIDMVESQLKERMAALQSGLRRQADIQYQSLPDALRARMGE